MNDDTGIALTADILLSDDKTPWYPARRVVKPAGPQFPPDEDIELWLKHNGPLTFQQLADIRYSLYHHCSRADFTITNIVDVHPTPARRPAVRPHCQFVLLSPRKNARL